VIVKEYRSKKISLYHFDLYRLKGESDLCTIGYEEYFYSKKDISVIEWAEKAKSLLPAGHITVKLRHLGGDK